MRWAQSIELVRVQHVWHVLRLAGYGENHPLVVFSPQQSQHDYGLLASLLTVMMCIGIHFTPVIFLSPPLHYLEKQTQEYILHTRFSKLLLQNIVMKKEKKLNLATFFWAVLKLRLLFTCRFYCQIADRILRFIFTWQVFGMI